MKKVFLILILFLFSLANSETLKAGISEEYVPEGFYGSWGVISKIQDTTNHAMFNSQSEDIWVLSGYSNVLYLQNLESGAKSQIILKEKSKNNVLKFEREKVVKKQDNKQTIYKETVEFTLSGNKFSGHDNFIVENWENGKIVKKNSAKYKVSGVKISGKSPIE